MRITNIHTNGPTKKVVLLFSDVENSRQYYKLIETIRSRFAVNGLSVDVIVLSRKETSLYESLSRVAGGCISVIRIQNLLGLIGKFLPYFWVGRPNVIFVSGWTASKFALPMSRLLGIPNRIVVRHHGSLHFDSYTKLRYRIAGRIWDSLVNKVATTIVAVSESHGEFLISSGVPKPKLHIINNSLAEVETAIPKSRYKTYADCNESNPLKFGVVARHTKWKGIDNAVKALGSLSKDYPFIKLTIVGQPADNTEEIQRYIALAPNLNVEMIPRIDDIASFYRELDCLIHIPINRFCESFGQVILESIWMGVPLIATSSGILGKRSFLDAAFYKVEFQNFNSLVNSIELFLNQNSVKKLSSNARKLLIQKFCTEAIIGEYIKLLFSDFRLSN